MMTDKVFSLIRPFADKIRLGRPKTCMLCDQPITMEAVFSIGNDMSVIERYCSRCAENLAKKHKKSVD